MSTVDGIDTDIQRRMLGVGVRNSARSVPMLMVAVVFLAWLAWNANDPGTATLMMALGVPVSVWRCWLYHRYLRGLELTPEHMAGVVMQLESNAALVGLMWASATFLIYPTLSGTMATVYVVMVCGSIMTAAFFLSIVGRSFVVLMVLQLGSLVVVSGQIPLQDGKLAHAGKVGAGVTPEVASQACRLCFINVLAQLKAACDGDLDRVTKVLRLGGFIAAPADFIGHPAVMNGASDQCVAVFGEAGKHARSTIGVPSLPADACCEVEGLFEIRI